MTRLKAFEVSKHERRDGGCDEVDLEARNFFPGANLETKFDSGLDQKFSELPVVLISYSNRTYSHSE